MWNTDGISLYESSTFDVWPFYFVINELSPEKRYRSQYVLLAEIWGSKQKPHPNMFLKHICKDVLLLNEGISVKLPDGEEVIVKIRVLCGTCDTSAKATFQNLKLHSGYMSSPKCLVEGEKSDATGDTMVFPFEKDLLPRTEEVYQYQVEQSVQPQYKKTRI